jgi:hypothetical protein
VQQKFRFRQGANVFKEMLYLADRYNIREFIFVDSLVNGNLKSMTEWITALAEYNRNNPDKRITWSGSWICRPIGQIKENLYSLMAASGCDTLSVGAESGSNSVLEAMDKKTTVEAFLYEAEIFKRHNIKFIPLLIIGHWSEQWEDFLSTIHMLYNLKDYVKHGNLPAFSTGSTMELIKGSPMDHNFNINKLEVAGPSMWWTPVNPGLTAKERYFRLLLLISFCKKFNLPIQESVLPYVNDFLNRDFNVVKQFYAEKTSNIEHPTQYAEFYIENFDQFVELIESKYTKHNVKIELVIESHSTKSDPGIVVTFNNHELINQTLSEGTHAFLFDNLIESADNTIAIRFNNKSPDDTIVDQQGHMLKDKFLEIKKLSINSVSMLDDVEFYQSQFEYLENNLKVLPKFGFWFNDTVASLTFEKNFNSWYHRNSKKNTMFTPNIISNKTTRSKLDDDQLRQNIINMLKKLPY